MNVEEILKNVGYNREEISAMIHLKVNTGLAWKSIIILRENKKDNDIFAQIVNRVIENEIFKSTKDIDNFIQTINTMEIPDLGILYNR